MLVLSLGDVYALIAESGLPFSTVQRVSTRFIAIPLLVFIIISIKGLDLLLKDDRVYWKKAVLLGIPFIIFELHTQTAHWRVDHLEKLHKPVTKPVLTLLSDPSPSYSKTIYISWLTSKSALVILLLALALRYKSNKQQKVT